MERLTEKSALMNEYRLKDTSVKGYQKAIDKLAEFEDLEEQDFLKVLPCKVGNTIYVNGVLGVGEAEEYKVIRVDYHDNLATGRSEFYIKALLVNDPENSIGFYDKEFGKTVFLTQAEAEQKLKEIELNKNLERNIEIWDSVRKLYVMVVQCVSQ